MSRKASMTTLMISTLVILLRRPWASRTDEIIEANEAMRLKGEEEKPKKKRAPRKKKENETQEQGTKSQDEVAENNVEIK